MHSPQKRIITLALLLFALVQLKPIMAQVPEIEYGVRLIGQPKPDSIMLRWAPINSETWRLANQYGYTVKRHTVLRKKKIPKEIEHTVLTTVPVKPVGLDQWEKYSDDRFMAIAAECIYGSAYEGVPVGGNPHLAYKKYLEEKQRFSFALYAADQSIEVARLSGLYFVDKTAQPDEKYLYQVYINCPDSFLVDTGYIFTGISEYQPLPKPLELRAEWGNKVVDLSWNILYLNHLYNSYFIEKSTDGGKTWQRTSENNTVQVTDPGVSPDRMYKTDTIDNNTTTYYYRIRGISTFGEISPASDSVFGTGRLPIKKAPVIYYYELINNEKVKLFWDYPEEMNAYITGFKIFRAKDPRKRKKLVYVGTDPAAREFIDTTPNITNYYLISVYSDTEEKLSALRTYVERVDSFPPKPPRIESAIMDSTGHITITWHPNHEEDLDGYRVYRANDPKWEFMSVTPAVLTDTVFYDSTTLKTLTRKIYYKVKACDVRLNQSQFSEMITLTRPDIIPPVSPVIKNIGKVDKGAELTWVNSSSADLASHRIYRKFLNDTVFELISTQPKNGQVRSTWSDEGVVPGKEYTYYIAAVDSSNLESPPSNYGYFKFPSGIKEGIKLKSRVNTDRIKLVWNITAEKEVEKVLVYRSVNNGPLRIYGNSHDEFFIDNRLTPEKKYGYAVKAIYTDGSSSVLSKTIYVKM